MQKTQDYILDYTRLAAQRQYTGLVREHLARTHESPPLALVHSFGCQQNAADGEKLRGMLAEMGYGFTDALEEADFIIYNTCAVRENAEKRVFGTVGALKQYKRQKPGLLIALVGCMTQQQSVADRLKRSYPHVDIVAGADAWASLPERIYQALCQGKRSIKTEGEEPDTIVEGLPTRRTGWPKAWVTVMYGCNNFCSYCVVPYVRGRERSRRPEEIIAEARQLVAEGYKEITLLGQNVNSYGKDLDEPMDFADLLRAINDIPGEFLIRFMTSHPKDATEKLFRTMAECEKCAHQLHLPVQSGNDRVLKAMNRHYDRAKYLEEVALARRYMPDLVLTTDIIVGFPGETPEEFEDTLSLVEQVRYDSMFTFIFSPRKGTPAAVMPDPYSRQEKQVWFDRLLDAANRISAEKHKEYEGKRLRVLVDGLSDGKGGNLSARTGGGRLVHLTGDPALIGQFVDVTITGSNTWALYGEPV